MFAALYNAKQKTENRRDDPMNRKKTALLLSFLIAFGAVSACSQKPSETESTIESAASMLSVNKEKQPKDHLTAIHYAFILKI